MTPEQLAALREVAERAIPPFWNAQSEELFTRLFKEKFYPAACKELIEEVERLTKEIADYEQTDLVPRSRWEATNNDWLEARKQFQELARKATTEIERLEAKVQERL